MARGRKAEFQPRTVDDIPIISARLLKQLDAIEPSVDRCSFEPHVKYWPASVELKDGKILERVSFLSADSFINHWGFGVRTKEQIGSLEVSVHDVKKIWESPHRLPAKFANKIYAHGESGMGLMVFTLVLKDGRRKTLATGNAVDFVGMPRGVSLDMIDDISHEGTREDAIGSGDDDAKFCPFRFPEKS